MRNSVMLLAWPFFFAANCFSRNAAEQFSTVRLRIAENGLRFFSKIAHHIVDDEIWKITFPQITIPIEDGPGTGEVNTTELTLRRFKSPIFSFKLTPPNGISWQSKGGSAELDAIWLLRYYFIAPIYLSGYIRAKMDNIRVYMETNLLVRDEHPQIEVTDCSVDIRKLNVYITGGVLQWIINLFRAQLAVVIKQTIHQEMCDIIRKAIADTNAALLALSTHVKLYKNIYIRYSCKKNPIAMSKYIEGEMVFDVMYGKDECVLPTKQMDSEVHSTKRMAYVWMSEYIPNCLLQTVYNNENLTFAITPSTSGGRFAGFLRTNCGFFEICIGKFLPTLRLRYPNRIVFFFIRLAGAPYTIIDANNIRIFANSTVDLYLPSEKQQQSQRLARLVMNSTIYAIPAISHRKLVGTISNVMIILHEQDSVIGHFSFQTLEFLEKVLAKAVKLFGGTALKIGVPLPLIDSVTISDDAQIITKNGYLHLDFDFIYG
uniref:Lipid-binding serum glycoprotein C-terminal domain-containing protein n=1 Tax=Onchocerca volvulus TaxID=6282 RepID=A0A8R1Y283_ONCVO